MFALLGLQKRLNFLAIGMVIGQGGMHLGQAEMAELVGDLLGTQALFIPARHAVNSDSRSRYAGAPAFHARRAGDEAADFHCGWFAHGDNIKVSPRRVKLAIRRWPVAGGR